MKIKEKGYWSREKCEEAALECETKSEFKSKYSRAYSISLKNGWLDELCSHMRIISMPNNYWTKERCEECSKKCNSRSDFYKKFPGAYKRCRENGWLDELCSHMKAIGNLKKRLIYIFEFSDNSVYIGLTYNIEKREKEHINGLKSNTAVYKHIVETGLIPKLNILTDYLELDEAVKMEKYYIEFYSKNGYKVLNIKKGGETGYKFVEYTYELCKSESEKYINRKEFSIYKRKLYDISILNGWLDDFYPKRYGIVNWDYFNCKEESKKYKTRSEFRKSRTAYNMSSKNGWLDDFYPKK